MSKKEIKGKNVLTDSDETLGKPIRIACAAADTIDINQLSNFQGNLKNLPEESYRKLRGSILEFGVSFPICAWKYRNKTYILDAHQRVHTMKRMRDEEGFQIPPLPVVWVEAATKKEAARKVLAATSQYGEIQQEGLKSFMEEFDLKLDEVTSSFKFPEINFPKFEAAFFPKVEQVTFNVNRGAKGSTEIAEEEFNEFDHKCPKCGFEFDEK